MRLDLEDADGSETLMPARPRSELDWETVNKVATQSAEFQDFLRSAKNAVMTNKVNLSEFDPVLEQHALMASLASL